MGLSRQFKKTNIVVTTCTQKSTCFTIESKKLDIQPFWIWDWNIPGEMGVSGLNNYFKTKEAVYTSHEKKPFYWKYLILEATMGYI